MDYIKNIVSKKNTTLKINVIEQKEQLYNCYKCNSCFTNQETFKTHQCKKN